MNILFVCTGNTCRSPMAEWYLKSKNISKLSVFSRGLSADGSPISENSYLALKEKGIDIKNHISKQISLKDIEKADKILCLSASHKEFLKPYVSEDKLFVLSGGISDPYGNSLEVYKKCRDEIFSAIDTLINQNFFSEILVRLTKTEDIPLIAELERICFSEPWSENAITESLKAGTVFLTAFYNREISGYMGISCILDEGYVTNIAVFPDFRRKGIASALIQKCFDLAKEKNLSFVSLEVRKSNQSAISLYEKLGFVTEGIRKNFYRNPCEDAIIMTKRFEKNENT